MLGPSPGVSDNFSGDAEASGPGIICWEPLALINNGIHQHSPKQKFGQDACKQIRREYFNA